MSNNLRMQFIEVYLRDGVNSPQYRALKDELYQQGATWLEIVELHIAANLYGNLDNFYRKQPQA